MILVAIRLARSPNSLDRFYLLEFPEEVLQPTDVYVTCCFRPGLSKAIHKPAQDFMPTDCGLPPPIPPPPPISSPVNAWPVRQRSGRRCYRSGAMASTTVGGRDRGGSHPRGACNVGMCHSGDPPKLVGSHSFT